MSEGCDIPDWLLLEMKRDANRFPPPEVSNRDTVLYSLLGGALDLDAQLMAIKGVLRQNREAEAEVAEAIKALEAHIRNYASDDGEYQIHIENHWVDTLHGTVFQDAAHSMSAVGMLAPFTESLIVSIVRGLRTQWTKDGRTLENTVRGPSSASKFWDTRWVRSGEVWTNAGHVQGSRQLFEVIGLSPFLPGAFSAMHGALTAYRNRMFHNGFEWPMDERRKFAELIVTEGWPADWFKKSMSAGDPWIYYMSDEFIAFCLNMTDQALEGAGRYLKEHRA